MWVASDDECLDQLLITSNKNEQKKWTSVPEHRIVEPKKSTRDKIKQVVAWAAMGISCVLAAVAVGLLVAATSVSRLAAYDDGEPPSGSVISPRENTIRVTVSKRTARILITRATFDHPSVELDLEFQGLDEDSSDYKKLLKDVGSPEWCERTEDDESLQCVRWPGQLGAVLKVTQFKVMEQESQVKCYNVSLVTNNDPEASVRSCLPLTGKHLYGGPVLTGQHWPTEKGPTLNNVVYLTGYSPLDGISERFWITSAGEALFVEPGIPLFVSQDSKRLCLESRLEAPYHNNASKPAQLDVILCEAPDPRQVFLTASKTFLGLPSAAPDERMLRSPVWSTWAEFKQGIDADKVMKFANAIKHYGFQNSQIEIDDRWEPCYGHAQFDTAKFPDARGMINTLHSLGFRVTVWMHPFVNVNCDAYKEAHDFGLLIRRPGDNATDTVQWWDGRAGILDFSDPRAAAWYAQRVNYLKEHFGVDGFKFDAGEAAYVPELGIMHGPEELQPAFFGHHYARAVSTANPGMAEMRSLFMAQKMPLVVRMIDKDSTWDLRSDGIKALVPCLLNLNMVGYSTIMPDMIGGNGYAAHPTKELFIRWLQASLFMPVLQFSYTPWDFDQQTVNISKKLLEFRSKYDDLLIALIQKKMKDGTPVNPPLWWIAVNDTQALVISDEYLFGEHILVAPVLDEGATSRDIYLPSGTWRELYAESVGAEPAVKVGTPIRGPTWLKDHPAPLEHLPVFERLQEQDVVDLQVLTGAPIVLAGDPPEYDITNYDD